MSTTGSPFFTFSLPVEAARPHALPQLRHYSSLYSDTSSGISASKDKSCLGVRSRLLDIFKRWLLQIAN